MNLKQQEIDRLVATYTGNMKGHQLTQCAPDTCRMGKPDTGFYSVYITFLPTGQIAIYGDSKPGRRGVISDRGYGKDWFVSELDQRYLAEKFLEKKFQPDVAKLEAKSYLQDKNLEEGDRLYFQAIVDMDDDQLCPHSMYQLAMEYGMGWEDLPGQDYDLSDLAMLTAIQRKFRELQVGK